LSHLARVQQKSVRQFFHRINGLVSDLHDYIPTKDVRLECRAAFDDCSDKDARIPLEPGPNIVRDR
jgi:hypothetical protein